jgi:hypothetical protein
MIFSNAEGGVHKHNDGHVVNVPVLDILRGRQDLHLVVADTLGKPKCLVQFLQNSAISTSKSPAWIETDAASDGMPWPDGHFSTPINPLAFDFICFLETSSTHL